MRNRPRKAAVLVIIFVICAGVGFAVTSRGEFSGLLGKIGEVVFGERDEPVGTGASKPVTPTVTETVKNNTVNVFFPDATAERLVAERRDIGEEEPTPDVALTELLKGPKDSSLSPALPEGTKVLDVTVSDSVATVDFNAKVAQGSGGSTGELMEVYSVVQTLTSLPGIGAVRFLVEGSPVDTLYGHLDLSQPVGPDESLVAQ